MKQKFHGLFAAMLMIAFAGPAMAATIIHSPVLSAVAGKSVEINASLSGVKQPSAARLYFRARGKELYQSVEMGGSAFSVSASITGTAVTSSGLEYYIELTDASGTVTDPAVNARINPRFVSVRQSVISANLTILSPAEGEILETGRPVFSVAFQESDVTVDASAVIVEIDGKAISDRSNLNVYSTLMSYIPGEPLSEGSHQVHVAVKNGDASQSDADWSFVVKSKVTGEVDNKRNAWFWTGGLKAETQYAHVMTQPDPAQPSPGLVYKPYGANRATLDVTGRGPRQVYRAHVYKTDEERDDQQALDRYTLSMSVDDSVLTVGDYSPNFSVLSLYNLYYLRGITLDLRSGNLYEAHSRLLAVYGQTRRGVNANATNQSGGAAVPSYYQYLYGMRYEWGITSFLTWGVNTVTVNDDAGDLTNKGSVNPMNNTVATSDARIDIRPLYLSFDGEVGDSLFMQDTSPLSLSVGSAYKAAGHLNVLPSSTRLDFEWRDLGGRYPIVPGGYTSSANPGLITDYRGFESGFSQSLYENKVGLNLAFNSWHDNLQETKPATTRTNYMAGFLNLAPWDTFFANLGYSLQSQANDAKTSTAGELNSQFGNFSGTLGYSRVLNPLLTVNGTFSMVMTNYSDLTAFKLSPNFGSNTYVLTGFAAYGVNTFNAAASLGGTSYESTPGNLALGQFSSSAYKAANTNFNLRYGRTFRGGEYNGFLGYDLNSSTTDALVLTDLSNSSTSTVGASSSGRSTVTLGGGWIPMESQRVDLNLAYAQVNLSNTFGVANSYTEGVGTLSYRIGF